MKLELFTADYCTQCGPVKRRLNSISADYIEQDIGTDEAQKQRLLDAGYQTIPMILINDTRWVHPVKENFLKVIIEERERNVV